MKFIIEHLEPKLWPWCIIEYKHISKIVGKNNLIFTNIKKQDTNKLRLLGKVEHQSIAKLNLKNICVLDPEATRTLTQEDKNKFNYVVFGGILGDYPPRKRTKEELTKFLPTAEKRNIGKEQMSTDNAVYVTKQILGGKKFQDLKFQDNVEIKINKIESVSLPYRYALINGKPLMSKEIIKYLKKKKGL